MGTDIRSMEGARPGRQGRAARARYESKGSSGSFQGLRRVLARWFFPQDLESEKPVEALDRTAESLSRIAAMNEENMRKMLLSQERIAVFQEEAEHKQRMRQDSSCVVWHELPRGRCVRSAEENADFAEAMLACEISHWEDLQERELQLNRQEDTCVTDLHALRVDIAPCAEKRDDYLALLS
ncbi:MAG: hypothetical protein J5846_09475 [Desulfovibrio sp.]|nr:hypothetical protein [Desulfovibrio sp.]